MFSNDHVGEMADAETRDRGGHQRRAVIGLEASLRAYRYGFPAVQEMPRFRTLHQRLVGEQFFRCRGRPVGLDVFRTRHGRRVNRSDASSDKIGVLEIADPYRAVIAFRDQVDDMVAIAGVDLQLRMASRHLREQRGEVRRAERERGGDAQAAAQLAGGCDRFPCQVDLGAGPGRMVAKRGAGFRQRRAARGAGKQLDAQVRFQPGEPAADDRLGDAEPERGGRDSAGIGHFHEGP